MPRRTSPSANAISPDKPPSRGRRDATPGTYRKLVGLGFLRFDPNTAGPVGRVVPVKEGSLIGRNYSSAKKTPPEHVDLGITKKNGKSVSRQQLSITSVNIGNSSKRPGSIVVAQCGQSNPLTHFYCHGSVADRPKSLSFLTKRATEAIRQIMKDIKHRRSAPESSVVSCLSSFPTAGSDNEAELHLGDILCLIPADDSNPKHFFMVAPMVREEPLPDTPPPTHRFKPGEPLVDPSMHVVTSSSSSSGWAQAKREPEPHTPRRGDRYRIYFNEGHNAYDVHGVERKGAGGWFLAVVVSAKRKRKTSDSIIYELNIKYDDQSLDTLTLSHTLDNCERVTKSKVDGIQRLVDSPTEPGVVIAAATGEVAYRSLAECDLCYLKRGDLVSANFQNKGNWYRGRVVEADNHLSTCTIAYDDGDVESDVPYDEIRLECDADDHGEWLVGLMLGDRKIVKTVRMRSNLKNQVKLRMDRGSDLPYDSVLTYLFEKKLKEIVPEDRHFKWPLGSKKRGRSKSPTKKKSPPKKFRSDETAVPPRASTMTRRGCSQVKTEHPEPMDDEVPAPEQDEAPQKLKPPPAPVDDEKEPASSTSAEKDTPLNQERVAIASQDDEGGTAAIDSSGDAHESRSPPPIDVQPSAMDNYDDDEWWRKPYTLPVPGPPSDESDDDDDCDVDAGEFRIHKSVHRMHQSVGLQFWKALNSPTPDLGFDMLTTLTTSQRQAPTLHICTGLVELLTVGPKMDEKEFPDAQRMHHALNYLSFLIPNNVLIASLRNKVARRSKHMVAAIHHTMFEAAGSRIWEVCLETWPKLIYCVETDEETWAETALERISKSLLIVKCSTMLFDTLLLAAQEKPVERLREVPFVQHMIKRGFSQVLKQFAKTIVSLLMRHARFYFIDELVPEDQRFVLETSNSTKKIPFSLSLRQTLFSQLSDLFRLFGSVYTRLLWLHERTSSLPDDIEEEMGKVRSRKRARTNADVTPRDVAIWFREALDQERHEWASKRRSSTHNLGAWPQDMLKDKQVLLSLKIKIAQKIHVPEVQVAMAKEFGFTEEYI